MLAELLTTVVSDTLGRGRDEITIVLKRTSKNDIARDGKFGRI